LVLASPALLEENVAEIRPVDRHVA
jgi:hypothetical protein